MSAGRLGCSWSWRCALSGVWFDRDFKPWLAWRLNVGPLHIVKLREDYEDYEARP